MSKGLTYSTARSAAGQVKQAVVTFRNKHVPLTDNAGVVAYGSLQLFDFPQSGLMFLGAVADLALTKSSAGVNTDWDGDFSLGTVTADSGATLATTEQDLIPTTATPQATAGATTAKGISTATEAPKIFDGTGTAKDVFLNLLVDDADHDVTTTPCDLILNGVVKVTYVLLGDK
jgi:hypothetical protein